MDYKELVYNVQRWGLSKGIIQKDNSFKQFTKAGEEFGEIAHALCKNDMVKLEDGIGDTMVTLIILAYQNGLDFKGCLETAYNEIKDRKGETVNGVFIKEEDLKENVSPEKKAILEFIEYDRGNPQVKGTRDYLEGYFKMKGI